MLLQMGPLLRLGPNVITDGTFITLGSIYYTCAFYTSLDSKGEVVPIELLNPEETQLRKGENEPVRSR